MKVAICEKGHWYDMEVDAVCPKCAAEAGARNTQEGWEDMNNTAGTENGFGGFEEKDDYGATQPVSGAMGGFGAGVTESIPDGMGRFRGSVDDTQPVRDGMEGFQKDMDDTQPVQDGMRGFQNSMGVTESVFDGMNVQREFDDFGETQGVQAGGYQDQTMARTPGNVRGFMPVTGWLVCIAGPDKGHDYRIHNGYNTIGRGENMDICIRGDMQISREKHAMVAYDYEERVFFFGPADGKNIVRLNDKMVMMPMEIHAYDVLTIGSSKLMFIPLCGTHFDWTD